jgi:hypothetical protein
MFGQLTSKSRHALNKVIRNLYERLLHKSC